MYMTCFEQKVTRIYKPEQTTVRKSVDIIENKENN